VHINTEVIFIILSNASYGLEGEQPVIAETPVKRIAQGYDANITNVFHPLVRNSFQIHDFSKNKNGNLKKLFSTYNQ